MTIDPNKLTGTPRALYRVLEREGYLRTPDIREGTTHPLDVPFMDDRAKQLQAWLLESLFVALTHSEPIIAFRALLQAYSYNERASYGTLAADALLEARNRIEPLLKSYRVFP